MATVDKTIQVDVPVGTAYNQWTQFESFPHFMEGVDSVEQTSETTLHWKATIAGKTTEWDARIVEQVPDSLIAWESTNGQTNNGRVTFNSTGTDTTEVNLFLETEPQGFIETVGDALGVLGRKVTGDLTKFKEYVESQGTVSSGWRGVITDGQVQDTGTLETVGPTTGSTTGSTLTPTGGFATAGAKGNPTGSTPYGEDTSYQGTGATSGLESVYGTAAESTSGSSSETDAFETTGTATTHPTQTSKEAYAGHTAEGQNADS